MQIQTSSRRRDASYFIESFRSRNVVQNRANADYQIEGVVMKWQALDITDNCIRLSYDLNFVAIQTYARRRHPAVDAVACSRVQGLLAPL